MNPKPPTTNGFSIVELLIVIVVIGILAALTVVGYIGVTGRAAEVTLKSDLQTAQTELASIKLKSGSYPDSAEGVTRSDGTELEYTRGTNGYCITVSSDAAPASFYYDSVANVLAEGVCPGHTGGGPPPIIALTTSEHHTCGIADGKAYCWGRNDFGQLGTGDTVSSSTPVPVFQDGALFDRQVTAISAGAEHTCAIADGEAFCWGLSGSVGKLGNNTTTSSLTPVPVTTSGVLSGKQITAMSAGNSHTCVIADAQVFCWGVNNEGQLGNNSFAHSLVPVAVSTSGVLSGRNVTHVSAGFGHTCALADGQAFCWGGGALGRLGNNSSVASTVPVAVSTAGVLSGKTLTALSGNASHTCVIADAQAYCWGIGLLGRLGNNSTANALVPVAVFSSGVLNGKSVTDIATFNTTGCVVADAEVFCWGAGVEGRLGNNGVANSLVPVPVSVDGVLSGRTITKISQGAGGHTCVIADGKAYCWGSNYYGELGDNSTVLTSSVPVSVGDFPGLE
jgi:prepilin-type N-terminal cleavage/methylation domain-containing protein